MSTTIYQVLCEKEDSEFPDKESLEDCGWLKSVDGEWKREPLEGQLSLTEPQSQRYSKRPVVRHHYTSGIRTSIAKT
jgi:hypothetical protein